MDLMENIPENNSKKLSGLKVGFIIVVILIIILIIAAGAIWIYSQQIVSSQFKFNLDGRRQSGYSQNLFMFQNNKIYVSIRDIASLLGYNVYNGGYGEYTEDRSKCYVQCEDEVANFALNSKIIYKLRLTGTSSTGQNYENYYMNDPVTSRNGRLYTTQEGLQEAFNVAFDYNRDTNRIQIYTMQYMINSYENSVLDYGYTEIQNDFNNYKAVLKDMLVVEQNSSYGVIKASTGETLIEPKYSKIEYLPETGDFLVTSNNQVGILTASGNTRVELVYDKLELMDSDSELYLAQRNGMYGVIDINGNIIIHLEYDEIGIDITRFSDNDIKNKYILAGNLIPVRKDKYWGFFDKTGKQVKDFMYDTIGYTASASRDARNLLVIPEYNVIVVGREGKYGLINSLGEDVSILALDDAYMVISGGEKHYYMTYNDNVINIMDYLQQQEGITVNSSNTTNNTNTLGNTTNTE